MNVGEPIFFAVELKRDIEKKDLEFQWTVERGEIADGQGTSQIRVISEMGPSVAATVKINGLPDGCNNKASETVPIAEKLPGCGPLDEYGNIAWEEEAARLDNFLIQMLNNPKSTAFFLIKIEEKDKIEATKKHITQMVKHMKSRKLDFDAGLLVFAIARSDVRITNLFLVPEGADHPKCEDCEFINGKHVYF